MNQRVHADARPSSGGGLLSLIGLVATVLFIGSLMDDSHESSPRRLPPPTPPKPRSPPQLPSNTRLPIRINRYGELE